jgi:nucleotide-binding universal stress UspA family protein
MIKNILVVADDTHGFEATLTSAIDLARRFGAHLDVLEVRDSTLEVVPLVSAGIDSLVVKEALATQTETRSRARRIFERLLPDGNISASWLSTIGWKPDAAAAAGRIRDLIVVGRADSAGDSHWRQTVNALLFKSGRPVLLLPVVPRGSFGDRIALAWNGSAQAAHATAAALPFLLFAEHVEILTGAALEALVGPAGLAACLARHGIAAKTKEFEPSYLPIGQALLEHAHAARAQLLVMGAYGHGLLREIVLGGATREILAESDLPVLMAH